MESPCPCRGPGLPERQCLWPSSIWSLTPGLTHRLCQDLRLVVMAVSLGLRVVSLRSPQEEAPSLTPRTFQGISGDSEDLVTRPLCATGSGPSALGGVQVGKYVVLGWQPLCCLYVLGRETPDGCRASLPVRQQSTADVLPSRHVSFHLWTQVRRLRGSPAPQLPPCA